MSQRELRLLGATLAVMLLYCLLWEIANFCSLYSRIEKNLAT